MVGHGDVLPKLNGTSSVRCHHLLKTFCTGSGGWADKQLPDGTVTWTAPTGRTYTTKPGGILFFPILATPTGEVTIRQLTTEPAEYRGLMMPRRKHTRAQEHHDGIATEWRIDDQRLKRQQWLFDELEKHRPLARRRCIGRKKRTRISLVPMATAGSG